METNWKESQMFFPCSGIFLITGVDVLGKDILCTVRLLVKVQLGLLLCCSSACFICFTMCVLFQFMTCLRPCIVTGSYPRVSWLVSPVSSFLPDLCTYWNLCVSRTHLKVFAQCPRVKPFVFVVLPWLHSLFFLLPASETLFFILPFAWCFGTLCNSHQGACSNSNNLFINLRICLDHLSAERWSTIKRINILVPKPVQIGHATCSTTGQQKAKKGEGTSAVVRDSSHKELYDAS